MATVQPVAGQHYHLPAGGGLSEHVGELELQGLELARRLAELLHPQGSPVLPVPHRRAPGDMRSLVRRLHVDESWPFGSMWLTAGVRTSSTGKGYGAAGGASPSSDRCVRGGCLRHRLAPESRDATGSRFVGAGHESRRTGAAGAEGEGFAALQYVGDRLWLAKACSCRFAGVAPW